MSSEALARASTAPAAYAATPSIVTAFRWTKASKHAKVRPPCGAAEGVYGYSIVDTPIGPRPIEPGDWLVCDAAGGAVPWENAQFRQYFVPSDAPVPVDAFA